MRGFATAGGAKAISLLGYKVVVAVCPWPADVFLQGGANGLVVRRSGGTYRTAFVEAWSDSLGFIRGEGPTVEAAEADCYTKALRVWACPGPDGHVWEARGYRNGAGFCSLCGRFGAKVFTAEQLGQFCAVCAAPTMWHVVEDADGVTFYCKAHVPHNPSVGDLCGCRQCWAGF